jgi:hypothetical protein
VAVSKLLIGYRAVVVVDELPAAVATEHPATGQPAAAVWRRLTTGRSYLAVKLLDETADLRRPATWRPADT